MPTAFERYGGFAEIRRIVAAFYRKVSASPRLRRHFAGIDMGRMIDHQTKFVAALMGGPASFTDEALRRAHARLGITNAEFDEMAQLLHQALAEFGIGADDMRTVDESIQARRGLIVAGASA